MDNIEFIIYVSDQAKSTEFYQSILGKPPSLNVSGMTEFILLKSVKLGLMPEEGIEKIIKNKMPQPHLGNGIPRCELYLKVKNPQQYIQRTLKAGGQLISEFQNRDWGDKVGYVADLDGHILALAEA